jgi:hypothetical protein
MLFNRRAGGISHEPAKSVAAESCGAALAAMTAFCDAQAEARTP